MGRAKVARESPRPAPGGIVARVKFKRWVVAGVCSFVIMFGALLGASLKSGYQAKQVWAAIFFFFFFLILFFAVWQYALYIPKMLGITYHNHHVLYTEAIPS